MNQKILNSINFDRKRVLIFSIFLVLAIELTLIPKTSYSTKDAIEIEDIESLQEMSSNLDENYILVGDIDATETQNWNGGKGFNPIGRDSDNPFTGNFNGNGHVIENLYINRPERTHVGLFGYINGGEIKKIGLENTKIEGESNVGGIVGRSDDGKISESFVRCNKIEGSRVGGIVGYNHRYSEVKDSYSTGNLYGDVVGGLVGTNWVDGVIEKSYSVSRVTGKEQVGNILGINTFLGSVSNCFFEKGVSEKDKAIGKNKDDTSNVQALTQNELNDISIFQNAGWNIAEVNSIDDRDENKTWNIVEDLTYPFLSWETGKPAIKTENTSNGNSIPEENNQQGLEENNETGYLEENIAWIGISLIGILVAIILLSIKRKR